MTPPSVLLVPHPLDFPVDRDKWERQAHLWWVWDRSYNDRLEWQDWTFCVGEPPLRVPAMARGVGWRHPTYEEACERQRRFNERDSREEWERWMGSGSWVNRRRIDGDNASRRLVIRDGGQEYAAKEYLAGHARDQHTRLAYGAR